MMVSQVSELIDLDEAVHRAMDIEIAPSTKISDRLPASVSVVTAFAVANQKTR